MSPKAPQKHKDPIKHDLKHPLVLDLECEILMSMWTFGAANEANEIRKRTRNIIVR